MSERRGVSPKTGRRKRCQSDLPPENRSVPTTNSYRRLVPGSLAEAVDALENDYKFLTAGNVFTDDLVEMWIKWKREEELDSMALRLHPYEFHPYYDS